MFLPAAAGWPLPPAACCCWLTPAPCCLLLRLDAGAGGEERVQDTVFETLCDLAFLGLSEANKARGEGKRAVQRGLSEEAVREYRDQEGEGEMHLCCCRPAPA